MEEGAKFDWKTIKDMRDTYITRLNGIYSRNLGNNDVELINVRTPSGDTLSHPQTSHPHIRAVLSSLSSRASLPSPDLTR